MGLAPFVRYPSLTFARKGSTWRCKHRDASWPLVLYARDVYHGTGRLLATLTVDRQDAGVEAPTRILTGSVDLLTPLQRKRFAEEVSKRLQASGDTKDDLTVVVTTMIDAMLERLQEARYEIDTVALADVEVPDDLTPRYVVWPFVPAARPGMLVAPSGSGKSSLAGMVGLTCISGQEILEGIEPRMEGPVLYIGQEEDAVQMRVRVEMMVRGHQLDRSILKHFHYVKLRGGSLIDSAEMLAELAANIRAVLIVVDSAQATWGNENTEGVRNYASSWFNAVETLEVPTLIVEHPSAINTKKDDGLGWAAGTTVKRDRSGHVWGVRSTEIPAPAGAPRRYHVTLVDSKRNYVARQANIDYEVLVHGYEWTKFVISGSLTAESVVDASRTFAAIVAVMRDEKDDQHDDGWTVADLADRLKAADDRRIRQEVNLGMWRGAPWNDSLETRLSKVEGTGGRGNPARFTLETRMRPAEQVELSMPPGDPAEEFLN